MCLVLFAVASCLVLMMDARQSKWIANIMKKAETQDPQAPTSAFGVSPHPCQTHAWHALCASVAPEMLKKDEKSQSSIRDTN